MPYIVRKVRDSTPTLITCGLLRKLTDSKDFQGMNLSHVIITDKTKRHYHKKLTEVYYVLKGSIDIEIDDKVESIVEGQMVMIFPKTNHKAWKTSKEDAEVLVACCPAFSEEDEILTETAPLSSS